MTIAHTTAQKIYKQLESIENFKDNFKVLMATLSQDNVYAWDNYGCPHEPTPTDIKRMLGLELKGLHVYAILDNETMIGLDRVHMISYLFVSDDKEDQPYDITVCDDNGIYYAIADVYNESWDIHEMGSILIEKSASAMGPRRCG